MKNNLEGKYYLITGASSGIGKATVLHLAEAGAYCVLVARNEERLREIANGIPNSDKHLVVSMDLTNLEGIKGIFVRTKEMGISLSGLVHCAGIAKATPLRTFSYSQAMELFLLHYFAFMELVKNYAKKGISNGGSIVGISSINAHIPQKCMSAYAAAKSAVEGACRGLVPELSEKGIRINSIVVGGVNTGIGSDVSDVIKVTQSNYINPVSRQLLGTGRPEQIASAICFLLSEESSFITGRELFADGGLF